MRYSLIATIAILAIVIAACGQQQPAEDQAGNGKDEQVSTIKIENAKFQCGDLSELKQAIHSRGDQFLVFTGFAGGACKSYAYSVENEEKTLTIGVVSKKIPDCASVQCTGYTTLDFAISTEGLGAFERVDIIVDGIITESFPIKDMFCGGIAGFSCPTGYVCRLAATYPDAGGRCVPQAEEEEEVALEGESCSASMKCIDGLFCVIKGTATSGTCEPRIITPTNGGALFGELCGGRENIQCEFGLACNITTSFANSVGKCVDAAEIPIEPKYACKQDTDCVRQKSCCDCGLGTWINKAYQNDINCGTVCGCAQSDSVGMCDYGRCIGVYRSQYKTEKRDNCLLYRSKNTGEPECFGCSNVNNVAICKDATSDYERLTAGGTPYQCFASEEGCRLTQ